MKYLTALIALTTTFSLLTACAAEPEIEVKPAQSEKTPMSSESSSEEQQSEPPGYEEIGSDVLDNIENPSSLPPQQCGLEAEDEVQAVILDFFCSYYNTLVTLEPQPIADITVSNKNTDLMAEFLRYQAAINRKNKLWLAQYELELRDYTCILGEDSAKVSFYCQCNMRFAGSETDSAEGLGWQASLNMTPEGWRITFIEPADWETAPTMYGAYREKIDNAILEYPEHKGDLWAITNLLITQYE